MAEVVLITSTEHIGGVKRLTGFWMSLSFWLISGNLMQLD